MKKRFIRFIALLTAAAACSGCYTRSTVVAGLSPRLKEYYSIYPSVELDIAAVTRSEAEDIRAQSAEDYFAADNPVRKGVAPYTLTFSSEKTEPQTMKRGVDAWDGWLEKKPEKLAVVANLPRGSEKIGGRKDPRVLILDLDSAFLWPDTLYFEIVPGGVAQIYKKPADPEYETKKLKAAREKSKQKKR